MITRIWKNLFPHHVKEKDWKGCFSLKLCSVIYVMLYYDIVFAFEFFLCQVSPKYETVRFECEFCSIFLEKLSPRIFLCIEWTPRLHSNYVRSYSSDSGMFLRERVLVGVSKANTTSHCLVSPQTRDETRSGLTQGVNPFESTVRHYTLHMILKYVTGICENNPNAYMQICDVLDWMNSLPPTPVFFILKESRCIKDR